LKVAASFDTLELIKRGVTRACLADVIELFDGAIRVGADRMLAEPPFA
jgi:hypothetical protein